MGRIPLLLALLLTACAADDGQAPDEPDIVITLAASGAPYCTADSQCEHGQTCAPDGSACIGAPDSHPCPPPAGTCDGSVPSCVDLSNDAYNCGACGNRCPWGYDGIIWCRDSVCHSAAGR